ncbi:RNA helicase family protein isoform X2 [Wolffia australiana]
MAVLPILEFEDTIVETVAANPVVVIIGETGSGKSTQLSQILHRRGYSKKGMIAVTQPRRVAAVSVARRVAQELGVRLGDEVGYTIRFEDRSSDITRIKYLTDGCLLRESLSSMDLNKYSVIILDEAHERSLNTDILLGLVKRLVSLRGSNLKLYSKERPTNYIESSLKTVLDIHTKEQPGDILIFMTGKDDIEKMIKKLEERIMELEEGSCMDAVVLPLHGSLPPEMQVRVFSPPPPNCRRIIVATNIAETSLTVDGVVYVVDSGYVKQRQYNPSTGMYSLDVVQISRVQADQRAGRAGRTQPGKCYRLYPYKTYLEEFLDATIPEIQRSSLAGTVLYLKSLDLPDLDILRFDFLDRPSRESLEDALRQLYLIDAIDEDGVITQIGRKMSELPLEPSLSRTLIEANELGCLFEALTVAAMLSAEISVNSARSKGDPRKRKKPISPLPDGSGFGDHIQLLQVYESWDRAGFTADWCIDHDIQVRGMMFAKDVHKQLRQIMHKMAKDPAEVDLAPKRRRREEDYRKLRRALCKGYGNQLAERMLHHNGYRSIGFRSQLLQVHPSSVLKGDEDGVLPDYVVYHELIATPHPFMRNVCSVEMAWAVPILRKLEKLDVNKLSGASDVRKEVTGVADEVNISNKEVSVEKDVGDKIRAARERYLARKGNKS